MNKIVTTLNQFADNAITTVWRGYKALLRPMSKFFEQRAYNYAKDKVRATDKDVNASSGIGEMVGLSGGFAMTVVGGLFFTAELLLFKTVSLGTLALSAGGMIVTSFLTGTSDGVSRAFGEKPFYFPDVEKPSRLGGKNAGADFKTAATADNAQTNTPVPQLKAAPKPGL